MRKIAVPLYKFLTPGGCDDSEDDQIELADDAAAVRLAVKSARAILADIQHAISAENHCRVEVACGSRRVAIVDVVEQIAVAMN